MIDPCGDTDLRSETVVAVDLLGRASLGDNVICLDRRGNTASWGSWDAPDVAGEGSAQPHQSPPVHDIEIGGSPWLGRTFHGEDGSNDLQVLFAGSEPGQAAVFHLPRVRTMLLGELAGRAAWVENPERSASVISRTLAMLDTGDGDRVYGQAPRLDLGLCGDEARAALLTILPRREP